MSSSSRARPHVGLSLLPAEDLREAVVPLFEEGVVDALEWTIDAAWKPGGLPGWVSDLLDHYAGAGRLHAHGVGLSPFSAGDPARRDDWLERAGRELRARRYVHVSEHYGFGAAGSFVFGAPLPPPRSRAALAAGRESLLRLADAARVPVGLENLALALGPADGEDQPALLDDVLAATGGFLLLDLHNLHCQAHNLGVDASELLARYPLERVRELHVSGGSFSGAIRRDTHDGDVPAPVLELLRTALGRCPNVEAIFLERMGATIRSEADAAQLRADFHAVRAIVERAATAPPILGAPPGSALPPLLADEEPDLADLQRTLLATLDGAPDLDPALAALAAPHSPYRAWLDQLDPRFTAIARELVRKWGRRAATGDLSF